MNWKIIVVVVVLCLVGIGGMVYGGLTFFRNRPSLVQDKADCYSKDMDKRLHGCTAMIDSGKSSRVELGGYYLFRGYAHKSRKEYDQSIQDFNQGLQLLPKDVLGYVGRGEAYGGNNDNDRAMSDFNHALQIDPQNSIAHMDRGSLYNLQGHYDLAIADMSAVIHIDPKSASAWAHRGSARAANGDTENALKDCNQSLSLKPRDALGLDCRAFTYLKLKKYALALPDYNEAIRQHPNPGWLYCRSLVKRHLNDTAGADADLAAAIAKEPKVAERYRKYEIQ